MTSRLRQSAYYAALALTAAAALAAIPALRETPLRVPITYERDGLFLTVLSKAIREDGFLHATRIGAPFGTDLVDWPLGMWLPFAQLASLTAVVGEPGTAINLYWMSTLVAAALCAAYAFRRLAIAPGMAFVLGLLYAFQPYAFYRNVEHVNLAFPFVPLLALLCLRTAGVAAPDESRTERTLALAACVAQGLSYVYYSVFACALLVFAAPLGFLRGRRRGGVGRALAAVALLAACSAAMVAPSVLYWHRHGYNPDLDYKPPAETDTYGLKLRHLLVPIAEHPLAPWRALAAKVEAVDFPGDNENVLSKLGTAGSVGLLALLALVLGTTASAVRTTDERLTGASALLLAALLLANVGGLASLFSVFVSPDVRSWSRIVVFVSFFCLLAFGVLASRAAQRLAPRLPAGARQPAAILALAALLVGGLLDQVPVRRLAALREGTAEAFSEERDLVRAVEARLPRGAMVFQLPHMTVPVDRATHPPMLYYDPARAFVHSRSLRWSWGSMIGRQRDWGRAVDALPTAEKLRTLALAGFSGVWIDRWGYTGEHRPPYAAVEQAIAEGLGSSPLVSSRGRYSFFDLEPFRRRVEHELGPEAAAHERAVILSDMPIARWAGGCADERPIAGSWWRSCGARVALELRNWRPGAIRVELTAKLRSAGAPARVTIEGPGFAETVSLPAGVVVPYERAFEIDGAAHRPAVVKGHRRGTVTLRVEDGHSPCGADACFELGDLELTTRRLIGGLPVNADGGVAARTKY